MDEADTIGAAILAVFLLLAGYVLATVPAHKRPPFGYGALGPFVGFILFAGCAVLLATLVVHWLFAAVIIALAAYLGRDVIPKTRRP